MPEPMRDFSDSYAAKMLRDGLARASEERSLSSRGVARELGYKASVVVSHMATGRVPIPLDRAKEIAEVIGLDVREFFLAVLEQRHPGAVEIVTDDSSPPADQFCSELTEIAQCSLSMLPTAHKRVLREVVGDKAPERRWLSFAELPVVLALRECRPDIVTDGLDAIDLHVVRDALKQHRQ